jgi:hypothetical protein
VAGSGKRAAREWEELAGKADEMLIFAFHTTFSGKGLFTMRRV